MHMCTIVASIAAGMWSLVTVYLKQPLQWRHNGRDGVSNHQPHHCLLNRLSGTAHRKHQSSASLAFVRGIHRWPVNSQHKWPVTRKMFPFDDVIMTSFMLSYSGKIREYIYVFKHFSTLKLVWVVLDNDLFILYVQYHVCWWSGSVSRQTINKLGIDQFLPGHSVSA